MSNKTVILCCIVVLAFIFGLLAGYYVDIKAFAEQTWPLKIWAQNENGDYHTLVVHDDETGIEYIVASISTIVYGEPSVSIAITPRLSGNGNVYYKTD